MKIAVFGATGGVGSAFIRQAVAVEHRIHALVRDTARLTVSSPLLEVRVGDVLDIENVIALVEGCDAVFCTLGNTEDNPPNVVSDGTANIVRTMEERGPRRLVIISSLGVGDSKNQVPFFFKVLAATLLRRSMQDKERQEIVVRDSGLDWTIIRPGGLNNEPAKGTYTVGLSPNIVAKMVARADVAAFALREIESPQYIRQTPAIT